MTTRDTLRRRLWQARLAVIVLLLGLIAMDSFWVITGSLQQVLKSTALLGLGLGGLYLYLTPCIHCRRPLGRIAFRVMGGRTTRGVEAAECPHCRSSIDREVPPRS
jgi:hypothetical protein